LTDPADAIQRATPQSIRVTSGASHHHSTGRSWGRYFAVSSPVDLTGEGSTGSQVYVLSVADYACQFGRPELQLPSEEPLVCPSPARPHLIRATSGTPGDAIDNPSVNGTGTIVAFEALGSYAGKCSGTPGAASRRQVFIANLATGDLKAVTCNPDGDSFAPSLNDAGGALTFVSRSGFLGGPSGIPQVYVYQYQNPNPERVGEITGITTGRFAVGKAPSGSPMLNKLGTHVAFESRADLLGSGLDTGIWNIFWFDRQLERLFQVTAGNGDSRNPYVEEKRPGSVFFDSSASNLPGTIPIGRQIYRADIKDTGAISFIEQFTFGPGNAWMPAVEPNGGKVLFLSDGDLLLNGTAGPRLFAIDFRGPRLLYQITGRGSIQGRIGASVGAWFASFDSDDDVGGYGVCGRQVWLTTYDPGHYTEAGHTRLAASLPGQVPGEPFPGNPDEGCADGTGCTADTCLGGQVCVHAQRPAGTVCGEGNICDGGVATCDAAGKCNRDAPLDCDDGNKCTDDTCDPDTGCGHTTVVCDDADPCTADTCEPATGCTHTALPALEGVTCQSGLVQRSTPSTANKQTLKSLRRATRLVGQASRRRARGLQRKLKQASKLFQTVLPRIASDPAFSRDQANELTERLYGLIDQISVLLNQLKTQERAK
jgi:Tol biopolymer transport system component